MPNTQPNSSIGKVSVGVVQTWVWRRHHSMVKGGTRGRGQHSNECASHHSFVEGGQGYGGWQDSRVETCWCQAAAPTGNCTGGASFQGHGWRRQGRRGWLASLLLAGASDAASSPPLPEELLEAPALEGPQRAAPVGSVLQLLLVPCVPSRAAAGLPSAVSVSLLLWLSLRWQRRRSGSQLQSSCTACCLSMGLG